MDEQKKLTRLPCWVCEEHYGRIRGECMECLIGELEATVETLRGQLTCAEVIAAQTSKIDDERQAAKQRIRELKAENSKLRKARLQVHTFSDSGARIVKLEAENSALRDLVLRASTDSYVTTADDPGCYDVMLLLRHHKHYLI